MQEYFNQNIKPLADELECLMEVKHLSIKQEGDETTLSVWVDDFCNHAGAVDTEVSVAEWDADTHEYASTGTDTQVVCYQCDLAYFETDQGGEWL